MMIIPPDRLILEMTRARRDERHSPRLPVLAVDALRVRIGHGLILAGRAIAGERQSATVSRPSPRTA